MNHNKSIVFNLYANCIPVAGYKRSVICDLQRNIFYFIPNDLFNILNSQKNIDIKDLKDRHDNKYDDIIDEYFDFLISNKLGHLTRFPEIFSDLSTEWHYPFEISNAIIDISRSNIDYLTSSIKQLSNLNCKHLQFRIFDFLDIEETLHLLKYIKNQKLAIVSIQVIVKNKSLYSDEYLQNLLDNYPRLSSIIIYKSNEKKLIKSKNNKRFILKVTEDIKNEKSCGLITKSLFAINIPSFFEAKRHNSCLNKKISIDVHGNIKNCPSMAQSFGNIKEQSLDKAMKHKDFKKYWNITKDEIDVCKDCEFRYICTDCRAYKENPEDDYSKPLKCGYNPYTNKWSQWSTNPLKQKAIEYYDMQELVEKND